MSEDAGDVDEDVEALIGGERLADEVLGLQVVRDVGVVRLGGAALGADLVHDLLGGGLVAALALHGRAEVRSEEHTSELQSLMRISYAVFCLKKKTEPDHPN